MVQYELVIDDGDDERGTITITVMISQTRTVYTLQDLPETILKDNRHDFL